MYEYNNPLYNPFVNPYLNAQHNPMQSAPKQEVVKVNGENGARAYPMGANSSAMLLDESGVIVWLVTTDGAGYKSVHPFDITPHQTPKQPDYSDLESRITKLEEMMQNATTNPTDARTVSDYNAYTANPSNDRHNPKHEKSAGNA